MADSRLVLVFAPTDSPLDYGRRLGRLRWSRALDAGRWVAPSAGEPIRELLEGSGAVVIVSDERAIAAPLPDAGGFFAGRVVGASPVATDRVFAHTLREVEEAGLPPAREQFLGPLPAAGFDPAVFPPAGDESVSSFVGRLFERAQRLPRDASFRALVFEDPSEHARDELLEWIPRQTRELCDVGCASGAAGATLRRRLPAARVTGIEKDPRAAARARERLDRVLETDAAAALAQLREEKKTFDAFLFADVLEHLEDPQAALALARALARPNATLVASVPNPGHLSLARDLIRGRFDYLPAGLADVGHLRWFDARCLRQSLEETGWGVEEIRGLSGGPPPLAESFLAGFSDWKNLDRESLATYQWIAVARALPDPSLDSAVGPEV